MKMKLMFVTMLSALLMGLSFNVLSQPKTESAEPPKMNQMKNEKWGNRFGPGAGRMNNRQQCQELLYKQLELNDKQMDKLIELKKEDMQVNYALREKLQSYQHLLHMAMIKDNLDEKEITSLAEQIGNAEQEMIIKKMEHLKKLKELLSKEQFKKLNLNMLMMNPQQGPGMRGERKGMK